MTLPLLVQIPLPRVGDGGGVAATVVRCFSSKLSSKSIVIIVCQSVTRLSSPVNSCKTPGTFCSIRECSLNFLSVAKSIRGDANSSEAVCNKINPRRTSSLVWLCISYQHMLNKSK